jgi:hypothetical protein
MRAGAGGELAAGRRLAADGLGDLLEAHAEHVVQQEGGALQRRQALQRHHQGQGDVLVNLVRRRLDDRLGQPGPDIGLAPRPRRLQLVQAQAGTTRRRNASGSRTTARSASSQRMNASWTTSSASATEPSLR